MSSSAASRHAGWPREARPSAGNSRIFEPEQGAENGRRKPGSAIRGEDAVARKTLLSLKNLTDFRRTERELAAAKEAVEQANLAKSRFFAAASHDLRQPLQTLTFLHDLLQSEVATEKAKELLDRAEETLDSMAVMLNALLDINQLETGTVRPQPIEFPIGDLLDRLRSEFAEHAASHGLGWRVVRSGAVVRSDPHLLEQMLRNLVSNAIRYTEKGKVLLGCRLRDDRLRIEVWDAGLGTAKEEIPRIFEDYHPAHGQTGKIGQGLGLVIVHRLGRLLDHPVEVRSRAGAGSVFAIEVPIGPAMRRSCGAGAGQSADPNSGSTILIVEANPELREILAATLVRQGHRTVTAASGNAALGLVASNGFQPDLVVSDFLLPGGMNGAQTATALRAALSREVPIVFLTGYLRAARSDEIALPNSVRLRKPVKPGALGRAIRRLLAAARSRETAEAAAEARPATLATPATVCVVDDDPRLRAVLSQMLKEAGYRVESFASGEALLNAVDRISGKACLIADVRLPGYSGFELLARLASNGNPLPAIIITGYGDIAMAVGAMKAGAVDFLQKPVRGGELLGAVDRALRHVAKPSEQVAWSDAAAMRIAGLTCREREVMEQVVGGHANKEIAARLGISRRTVETHRATVMRKLEARSLSELVRLVLAARSVNPSQA